MSSFMATDDTPRFHLPLLRRKDLNIQRTAGIINFVLFHLAATIYSPT